MRNKLVILIIFFLAIDAAAQETNRSNANVELPDFIITGKEVISVEQAKKMPPDLVSTISGKFIKPAYSPEELQLKEFPNPLKKDLNLFDSLYYNNGWLEAGLGSYYVPSAKLIYSSPFTRGVFEGRIGALNQRSYVENSDLYSLNGGASLYYFVNSESPVFDGTKFRLNGDLKVEGYKNYGAVPDTAIKNKSLNTGDFSFLINNLQNENFMYEFSFSDQLASLNNPKLSENLFSFDGFARTAFSAFDINVNLSYKRQYILNKLQDNSEFYFIKVRPGIGLNLSDILRAEFGISYAQDGSHTFSAPYASAALHLEKNITLFGEFAPSTEFLTENYFIRINPYFNVNTFTNLFFEKSNVLKAVLKYEYGRYFEINLGLNYYTSDEIPYFKNDTLNGTFNLATTGGNSIAGFTNLLFHLGPYGIFYGTAGYEDTKDDGGKFIPYHPEWTASLNYGYDFEMGLSSGVSLYYNSKTFADLINTQTLNSYIDLGLNFSYKITPGFSITLKMDNLINNENYKWLRYKDHPLNITGGIKVTW
jgi:hypothetical protein